MKLAQWPTLAGVLIVAAAVAGLLWTRVDAGSAPIGNGHFDVSIGYRWQLAMEPLLVGAAGLILVALARILQRSEWQPGGGDPWPKL
jgi:hypothetical protein